MISRYSQSVSIDQRDLPLTQQSASPGMLGESSRVVRPGIPEVPLRCVDVGLYCTQSVSWRWNVAVLHGSHLRRAERNRLMLGESLLAEKVEWWNGS